MKPIQVFVSSLRKSGAPGRGPFIAAELQEHNLEHPSDIQEDDIWSQAPAYLWPTGILLAIYFVWRTDGLLVIAAARLFWYLSLYCPAMLEQRNFYRWNRPDVFIGWSYSAIENDKTLPISPLGGRLIERMKPVWGAVVVIPMADIRMMENVLQQIMGNRGVFLPCLLVRGADWKPSVRWIIEQVRAAVFEISEEGKASLQWEIDEAIAVLGSDHVLVVRNASAGYTVSTAAGQQLERPVAIDRLPYEVEVGSHEEALMTIVGWCAENLYTPRREVNRTWRWYKLYDRERVVLWIVQMSCLLAVAVGGGMIAHDLWKLISARLL